MSGEFIEKLLKHIELGNVSQQDHPTEPLSIFTYTNKCQFDRAWDEVTMQCRGLILGEDYRLVSRPFKKFFNMSELQPEEIPETGFTVYDKMDGSLGITYWLNGEPHIATKGSFTSEQAVKATQMLRDKYPHVKSWDQSNTYLFEIIYPENRIVVDYGDKEMLVLIGCINTETGKETMLQNSGRFEDNPPIVRAYNFKDYRDIQQLNWANHEGFVVMFQNGFRMKLKFDEYIRLHKIITNVTSYDIWETLRDKKPLEDILDRVPDEFFAWVSDTITNLRSNYLSVKYLVGKEYEDILKKCGKNNRKEFAELAKQSTYPSMVFALLDGKDINTMVWDKCKPKFEKPFSNEYKSERRAGEIPVG